MDLIKCYNDGAIVKIYGVKQGVVAPKGTWGPLIMFISKFKFL